MITPTISAAPKWFVILHEHRAHAIVAEPSSSRGWRPLCQDSDLATDILLREINDRDALCANCRMVYGARLRAKIAKRRRLARITGRRS